MQRGLVLLSICGLNSGHSPAELNGTGDPGGTPVPVNMIPYICDSLRSSVSLETGTPFGSKIMASCMAAVPIEAPLAINL